MKKIILFALVAVLFSSCIKDHTYLMEDRVYKTMEIIHDYDKLVPGVVVQEGRHSYIVISEIK